MLTVVAMQVAVGLWCGWLLTMSFTRARQGCMTSCASLTRPSFRLGPAAAVQAWHSVTNVTQLRCRDAARPACWSSGGAPPEHSRPTAGAGAGQELCEQPAVAASAWMVGAQREQMAAPLTLGGVVFDLFRCSDQHLLAGHVHGLGWLNLEDVQRCLERLVHVCHSS